MKKTIKVIFWILLVGLIFSGAMYLMNEKIFEKKDDKVVITLEGVVEGNYQNVYAFVEKDGITGEIELLGQWRGTSVETLIEEGKATLVDGTKDLYTIDLTSSLPLGYTSAKKFFEDGGTITLVLNRDTTDGTTIQSRDLTIVACGNYILSTITENYETIVSNREEIDFTDYRAYESRFVDVEFIVETEDVEKDNTSDNTSDEINSDNTSNEENSDNTDENTNLEENLPTADSGAVQI